jgi:hypothetical protein
MGHTRQKLDEAHYFFEKMKESVEENNVFGYNLSAFLTAARSVTLFMQKEYSDKIGFDNWYKNKQRQMQADKEFKFFNRLRRATVHVNPVSHHKAISVSIVEPIIRVTDKVVISNGKDFEESLPQGLPQAPTRSPNERIENSVASRKVSRFFEGRPNEDLFGLCESYIQKLTKRVDECEQLFQ